MNIRASEKRFCQKIRELFAPSGSCNAGDKAARIFFAETQNKLIDDVTPKTAAGPAASRAVPDAPNRGLRTRKGNIVRKHDIITAKNRLTADELDELNRLATIFPDSAAKISTSGGAEGMRYSPAKTILRT